MVRLLLTTLLLGSAAWPAELQVLDDFEHGVRGWYLVEGTKPAGAPPLCVMTASAEAKVGRGAARLSYQPCPNTWTHMQLNISTTDWIANNCDRVSFWLKGDGSGERLNVMFGNYELRPALSYRHAVTLDFTGWRQFVVPFAEFEPQGAMAANLGKLVLVQLNVSTTSKPVDVLLDDLVALPAEREGPPTRFFDFVEVPTGGWDTRGPTGALPVDNLHGLPPDKRPPVYLHGIGNHPELHNPVTFAVTYPEAGRFGVKVSSTSGYGGSRLLLKVDGEERLRRDFPGETETALLDYRGYYGVPVGAGPHTITVDNDGKDWIVVEAYCFDNYRTADARLRREDGRVEAQVMDADGRPLEGVTVEAYVADEPIPLARQADGTWLSETLWGRFLSGRYPVRVVARRGEETLFAKTLTATLGSPRLRPAKTAFSVDSGVMLDLIYTSEADAPLPGQHLVAKVAGREVPCVEQPDGVYRADLGRLPAGRYRGAVKVEGGRTFEAPFLVYDAAARPWEAEGLIRLGPKGRFETSAGKPYTPWGYATIGLFAPDPEVVVRLQGPAQWCRASDEDIVNWVAMLAAYGVNCVRFGVTVDAKSIGGDTGGHADPYLLGRLRRLLDLIGPMGVRAIPVLWWGHYRNFGYQGIAAYDALIQKQADWFTNPEALKLQRQYVREVVEPFKDDPRILAWEVMNETYRAGGDLDAAIRWTNQIVATIRSVSPRHLITTSACEATPGPELSWIRAADVDFFNYHAYPTYPDYDSFRRLVGDAPRELGNYAALMTLCDRLGPKVSLLGETGNDRTREADYPELKALITRDCLWLSFLNGSPGGISWDAIADAREFAILSEITARVDWRTFEPAPTPVAVRVTAADLELPNLARYTWWSLEHAVPLTFVPPDAVPAKGQVVLQGDRFSPPDSPPSTRVTVSPGFQAAYLASKDSQVLIAYVRNLAGVPRLNVRARETRPLTITVRPPGPGKLEVWDLDSRTKVKELAVQAEARVELGPTAHDYAVVVAGR
ncbi:cellulase family glycosylhydrolase [bacterium]|nr:cellulase family glycosylhydrolase [bacterium]